MPHPLILITGANGGIGQHVLRHLLGHGHTNVLCHYRIEHALIDEAFRLHDLAPDSRRFQADLSDEASVMRMQQAITLAHGPVQVLVNVAGTSSNGMSWKLATDDVTRVLNDNVLSTFLCCKAFVPAMRDAGFGRVINFSSIVGATGIPGAAHYAAAKAAVAGFTKSVAQEVANRGVTVNALALGYFDAGMISSVPEVMQAEIRKRIPAGRFGSGKDVGAAVAYLMDEDAAFLTGQVIHLNGGQF